MNILIQNALNKNMKKRFTALRWTLVNECLLCGRQSHQSTINHQISQYKLTEEIIALSESEVWDAAKLEWKLYEIYEADEPERCLCGHFPIIEICVLSNSKNLNQAIVGNCCVKKFIGLPSDKIFQAIKRVRKDNRRSLNAEAIDYAFRKKWLNEWEKNFYLDIMRKRKLTPKQWTKKEQINGKLASNMRSRS